MRKQLLNQPVDTVNINESAQITKASLVNSTQLRIITLNPEMIVTARKNIEFQAAINNSHLIVPDGTGIVWGLKFLKTESCKDLQRVPGIELAQKILQIANELGKKVAIFGGKKNILEKAVNCIIEQYPNIQIVKAIDGYQEKEKHKNVALSIASESPDILFVALGTPLQEIWINKFASLFPRSILIGIGGSLDVWSGEKRRAPLFIQNLHLEWLYRIILDPKRIPRVLGALPVFICLILKEKIKRLGLASVSAIFII